MKTTIYLILAVIISITAFSGAVIADTAVSVDVPETQVVINEKITVPVTIHGAENVLAFQIDVPNTIPGATISISENVPVNALDGASGILNSDPSALVQHFVWFTSSDTGISGDMTLFYLDVVATADSPEVVPLSISVIEVANDQYQDVAAEYVVIPGSLQVMGAEGSNMPAQSGDLVSDVPENSSVVEPTIDMNDDITEDNPFDQITVESPTKPAETASPMIGCIGALGCIFLVSALRRK